MITIFSIGENSNEAQGQVGVVAMCDTWIGPSHKKETCSNFLKKFKLCEENIDHIYEIINSAKESRVKMNEDDQRKLEKLEKRTKEWQQEILTTTKIKVLIDNQRELSNIKLEIHSSLLLGIIRILNSSNIERDSLVKDDERLRIENLKLKLSDILKKIEDNEKNLNFLLEERKEDSKDRDYNRDPSFASQLHSHSRLR